MSPIRNSKARTTTSKIRKDKYGIPIIDREQIEDKAEEFIRFFNTTLLVEPKPTPVMDICYAICTQFKVPFVFDKDLGLSTSGKKILGRFQQKPRTIYIDPTLDSSSPRCRFTICHELGHLVFHRAVDLKGAQAEDSDTDDDVMENPSPPRTNREWMEWHANSFASSVLIPRRTLHQAVIALVKELGFTKISFGILYVDNQQCNLRTYYTIRDRLCAIYCASKICVEIRLKQTNILVDERLQSRDNIYELLREE